MAENLVTRLYGETSAVYESLLASGEPSFATAVDDTARKILLMASASYFEVQLIEIVKIFADESIGARHPLAEMARRKGIDRQYHTWFDWDAHDAKQFFRLFGEGFKKFMALKLDSDEAMRASIAAFLDIGSNRNALVHQNFGAYAVEKTTKEIFDTYETALLFVHSFKQYLVEYTSSLNVQGDV